MAVVGLVAGMVSTAMATATGPTGTCMATIRVIATTGIGVTKQMARRIAANIAKLPELLGR